jgi:hypothetical protein
MRAGVMPQRSSTACQMEAMFFAPRRPVVLAKLRRLMPCLCFLWILFFLLSRCGFLPSTCCCGSHLEFTPNVSMSRYRNIHSKPRHCTRCTTSNYSIGYHPSRFECYWKRKSKR